MNSAAAVAGHDALKRKAVSGETEAKLRARHQKLVGARVARESFPFPSDPVCFRIINRSVALYEEGFRDTEIDDRVGLEFNLQGWQVQYITLHFAREYMRIVAGLRSLVMNVSDASRQMEKEVFEDAPGRTWSAA